MSLKRLINKYINDVRNQCETFHKDNVSTNKKKNLYYSQTDLK